LALDTFWSHFLTCFCFVRVLYLNIHSKNFTAGFLIRLGRSRPVSNVLQGARYLSCNAWSQNNCNVQVVSKRGTNSFSEEQILFAEDVPFCYDVT